MNETWIFLLTQSSFTSAPLLLLFSFSCLHTSLGQLRAFLIDAGRMEIAPYSSYYLRDTNCPSTALWTQYICNFNLSSYTNLLLNIQRRWPLDKQHHSSITGNMDHVRTINYAWSIHHLIKLVLSSIETAKLLCYGIIKFFAKQLNTFSRRKPRISLRKTSKIHWHSSSHLANEILHSENFGKSYHFCRIIRRIAKSRIRSGRCTDSAVFRDLN